MGPGDLRIESHDRLAGHQVDGGLGDAGRFVEGAMLQVVDTAVGVWQMLPIRWERSTG